MKDIHIFFNLEINIFLFSLLVQWSKGTIFTRLQIYIYLNDTQVRTSIIYMHIHKCNTTF